MIELGLRSATSLTALHNIQLEARTYYELVRILKIAAEGPIPWKLDFLSEAKWMASDCFVKVFLGRKLYEEVMFSVLIFTRAYILDGRR